jgi:hypothetical protein
MDGKYGQAALKAVELFQSGEYGSPTDAWDRAASELFVKSAAGRRKGCPRNTFLGLCEEGLIKGIPADTYTSSKRNKAYALEGLTLLRNGSGMCSTSVELWRAVTKGKHKAYNQQMVVVLSLWNNGLIFD